MAMIAERTTGFAKILEDWPDAILEELKANDRNGHVGMILLSQTDRVRIWSINLKPGDRLPFHRHVLDYFWTAYNQGQARSRYGDGVIRLFDYTAGETKHLTFEAGQSMIHDLTNIGNTSLSFLTVEFLDSPNPALAL